MTKQEIKNNKNNKDNKDKSSKATSKSVENEGLKRVFELIAKGHIF